jgi:hypothetical protein
LADLLAALAVDPSSTSVEPAPHPESQESNPDLSAYEFGGVTEDCPHDLPRLTLDTLPQVIPPLAGLGSPGGELTLAHQASEAALCKPPDPENPNNIDEADIQAMMATFKDPNENAGVSLREAAKQFKDCSPSHLK